MRMIGLAAAAALAATGAAAESPAGRTVDPKCPPTGCPIPVPYPVKGKALAPTPTPAAADHEIKPHMGDSPGVLSGPRSLTTHPRRGINPNPTPPRNPPPPPLPQ